MNTKTFDIVIVGAGLIGSALALALVKKSLSQGCPLSIALVERSAQLTSNSMPNQRVIALGRVATNLLREIGVFDQLGASFANPYQRMFVWDEHSDGKLDFNAQEHDIDKLGYMVDSVQCTLLLQDEVARTSQISTYYSKEATSFNHGSDGLTARLTLDDIALEAPLMVAADGASSWLRQQAKIFANHRSYKQHGIVAKIRTEKTHQDTAWQRFLSDGPLALLPVENNECSIVWSVKDESLEHMMQLSDAEFEIRLSQALGGKLGKVTLVTKRLAFPLVSQQAQTYFAKNVALVGDAAHSIHPLAGQGANLGFKDVVSLVGVLLDEPAQALSNVGLLHRYQRARKTDNQQTDLMMSALHHAFQGELPAWTVLRGAGMNMVDRSKTLKTFFVQQAIGK